MLGSRGPTINVSRLHWAHVEPSPNYYYSERMVYVQAMDADSARLPDCRGRGRVEFIKLEEGVL